MNLANKKKRRKKEENFWYDGHPMVGLSINSILVRPTGFSHASFEWSNLRVLQQLEIDIFTG